MEYNSLPRGSYEHIDEYNPYDHSHFIPMNRIDPMVRAPSSIPPEEFDDRTMLIDSTHTGHADTSCSGFSSTTLMAVGDAEQGSRTPSPAKLSSMDEPPKDFDHFVPFPPLDHIAEEKHPLTARAMIIGCLLGAVVNAAMLFAGLKTGIAAGADFIGAIAGFGIVKGLIKVMPQVPAVGGPFGPKENTLIQAAARGSAGTSALFISIVPVMYKLGILKDPAGDFWKLVVLSVGCTLFGLFAAVPFRKFFILDAARELNMRFPSAEGLAITIRSMHEIGSGAAKAMRRFKMMLWVFCAAFVQKILAVYIPGLIYDWHIFTWFFIWGKYKNHAIDIENWGWMLQLSPQSLGLGILLDINVSTSVFIGSLLTYAIIGPILVHVGTCILTPTAPPAAGPEWAGFMNAQASTGTYRDGQYVASPYMWIMVPAIVALLCSGFVDLFLNFPSLFAGIKRGAMSLYGLAAGRRQNSFSRNRKQKEWQADSQRDREISVWIWSTGLLVSAVAVCLGVQFQWDTNGAYILLSLVVSALLSFISTYGIATTGVAVPTETVVIIGACGITQAQQMPSMPAWKFVTVASAVAIGVTDFATSLVGDFRVGFLFNTPSDLQFWAQALGTLLSGFTAPGVFVMFAQAWPCLITPPSASGSNAAVSCPLPAPMSEISAAFIPMLTGPHSASVPIDTSSLWFSAALAVLIVIESVARKFWFTGGRAWICKWMPSWFGLGLGFLLPPSICTTIFFGGLTGYLWRKKRPESYGSNGIAFAAALIAGESIGGLGSAILEIAGVGSEYGTTIGCPAGVC